MGKIEQIFKKIEDIFNSKYGYIYAYGIIFILCFFIMTGQNLRTEPHDDMVHSNAVKQFGSAFNFMIGQYENVNSRYFTSFIMAFVMDKNIWLWRILNTFVLFCLIYYTNNIIKVTYNINIKESIITIFAVFATVALLSSGIWTQSITWVTGSFNYLWSATALVISLYYLFNFILNKTFLKFYEFIILVPVIMYATNIEQSALIFLTMYFLGIIYAFVKYKIIDKYIFMFIIIGLISSYFVFTAPSISVRYIAEIKNWYPQFADLSFKDKVLQGYAYTVAYGMLLNNYTTTIALSVLLFIIYNRDYGKNKYNLIILLPALYSLFYYLGRVNIDYINSTIIYNLRSYSTRLINNNLNEPFISLIIALFFLFILLYFIFSIKWSRLERKYITILFYLAAVMSAFVLSFSPTIYASGERIWFIPYIMYILALSMVFMEFFKNINIPSNKFKIIFSIYILVGIIDVYSKVYK